MPLPHSYPQQPCHPVKHKDISMFHVTFKIQSHTSLRIKAPLLQCHMHGTQVPLIKRIDLFFVWALTCL